MARAFRGIAVEGDVGMALQRDAIGYRFPAAAARAEDSIRTNLASTFGTPWKVPLRLRSGNEDRSSPIDRGGRGKGSETSSPEDRHGFKPGGCRWRIR